MTKIKTKKEGRLWSLFFFGQMLRMFNTKNEAEKYQKYYQVAWGINPSLVEMNVANKRRWLAKSVAR